MSREKFNEKSTLMGRMGFHDPDLKENLHDKIISELYNDETLHHICKKYVYSKIIDKIFRAININPQIFKKIMNYEINLEHQQKCVEFPFFNETIDKFI